MSKFTEEVLKDIELRNNIAKIIAEQYSMGRVSRITLEVADKIVKLMKGA